MCKYGSDSPVKLNDRSFWGGKKTVRVDSCIAPVIQAIQDAGLRTSSCCCGHGRGASLIVWEDDAEAAAKILRAVGNDPIVMRFPFRSWSEITW